MLAKSRGDVLEEDLKREKSVKYGEHDIQEEDTEFMIEEDGSDEEKEDRHGNFWMRGPTSITNIEARIIQGRKHEFVVKMTNVRAPTFFFTNMRILDKEHAIEIYARLLTKKNVSSLTLRLVSYYESCTLRRMGQFQHKRRLRSIS